jgi:hypothetical protein
MDLDRFQKIGSQNFNHCVRLNTNLTGPFDSGAVSTI